MKRFELSEQAVTRALRAADNIGQRSVPISGESRSFKKPPDFFDKDALKIKELEHVGIEKVAQLFRDTF